jgi:uncharacterized protein (TIGR03067 family)
MRPFVCVLAVALLAVPLFGSDAPRETNGDAEMDDIGGSWLIVSAEYEGERTKANTVSVTYQGGRFTRVDDTEVKTGTYTTDARQNPARLDMTFDGGGTTSDIYRREGDTLQIGLIWTNRWLPTSFNDKGIKIYKYKRVK